MEDYKLSDLRASPRTHWVGRGTGAGGLSGKKGWYVVKVQRIFVER